MTVALASAVALAILVWAVQALDELADRHWRTPQGWSIRTVTVAPYPAGDLSPFRPNSGYWEYR